MGLLLPIPKSNVKEQLAGPAHDNLNPAVSNPHPQLRYAKMPMESRVGLAFSTPAPQFSVLSTQLWRYARVSTVPELFTSKPELSWE